MDLELGLQECVEFTQMTVIKTSLVEVGYDYIQEGPMVVDDQTRETIDGEIPSIGIHTKTLMLKKRWWYGEGLCHLPPLHLPSNALLLLGPQEYLLAVVIWARGDMPVDLVRNPGRQVEAAVVAAAAAVVAALPPAVHGHHLLEE